MVIHSLQFKFWINAKLIRGSLTIIVYLLFFIPSVSAQNVDHLRNVVDSVVVVERISIETNLLLGLFFEPYFFQCEDSSAKGRRPDHYTGVYLIGDFKLENGWTLPVNFRLSSPQTNFLTPKISKPGIKDILLSNQNSLYLNPRYKQFSVDLGSHIPHYSELTAGNMQVFGLGGSWNGKKISIQTNWGISQRVAIPHSINLQQGAYGQNFAGGSVSYKATENLLLKLNMVNVSDKEESLDVPIIKLPQKGAILSFLAEYKPSSQIEIGFEIANSANCNKDSTLEKSQFAPSNILLREDSIQNDFAIDARLKYKQEKWGIEIKTRFLGEHFMNIGYPEHFDDQIEISAKPYFNLAENKLLIRSQFGLRIYDYSKREDNLANKRIIGMFQAIYNPNKWLTINSQFANFGIRNNASIDTLKLQYVSNRMMLSPVLTYKIGEKKQRTTFSVSFEKFDEKTIFRPVPIENRNTNAFLNHNVNWNRKLQMGLSYSIFQNKVNDNTIRFRTYGFNARITPSHEITFNGSLSYLTSYLDGNSNDNRIGTRIGLRYRISEKMNFTFSYSHNNYNYNTANRSDFKEHYFKSLLTYRL